jgi:hypothetical protein
MRDENEGSVLADGLRPLDEEYVRRALDELFRLARRYRSSEEYRSFLDFAVRFRHYSLFNAMLVHVQMPGASFVASPNRWLRQHGRHIRPEGRPLVILQPMGPVMFVFDVSDTEAGEGAPALPPEIERPFEVSAGHIGDELRRTVENAKRDGVRVAKREAGSQSAGEIRTANFGKLDFQVKSKPEPESIELPVRYELILNSAHSEEAQYATLVHELAHLYCGHVGTPSAKWWPDRRRLPHDVAEFEAESVSYLVCGRKGIRSPSAEYLGSYLRDNEEVPEISLEYVVRSAILLEQMGAERLKPRSERTGQRKAQP